MAEQQDTMITPGLEPLLEKVDSKFTLVGLAAMRAREINAYYNQLSDGIGKVAPPQVTSTARKPLSIAFEEIEICYDYFEIEKMTLLGSIVQSGLSGVVNAVSGI